MKKSIEETVVDFMTEWNRESMSSFLRDIIPLVDMYDVDVKDNQLEVTLKHDKNKEDDMNICLLRTVYLIATIAEFHTGKLANIKMKFPNLRSTFEKIAHQ